MDALHIGDILTDDALPRFDVMDVLKELNVSAFLDNWGPVHVLQVYDPEIDMQGILVIDNLTLGPGCGGINISPHITPYDVFQQARTMTWACALSDVKLGGAAGGIRADPFEIDRTRYFRSFAREVSPYVPDQFIAAPSLYSGKNEMTAFVEEVGDRKGAAGKIESMGGIPYELGATGLGIGVMIKESIDAVRPSRLLPQDISEARIAIQGFESTGYAVANYLSNMGAKIVAISDEWSMLHDMKGIDVSGIIEYSAKTGKMKPLKHCKGIQKLPAKDITNVECDFLIATTGNKIITEKNVHSINARCIIEGVNNPITPIAGRILHKKGVMILPDILTMMANAICSYAEYRSNSADMAFSLVESKIRETARNIAGQYVESGVPLKRIAKEIAKEKILESRGLP